MVRSRFRRPRLLRHTRLMHDTIRVPLHGCHIPYGKGLVYCCIGTELKHVVISDGGLETWSRSRDRDRDLILWVSVSSRSRLSKVSVSSWSRGSKVSVSLENTLSRPQDLKKKQMKIEAWKKHSVGGRFQYRQWKKWCFLCRRNILSEKMMFFV